MPSKIVHFQGHTYEIMLSAQSWTEADQTARNSGGYLAKITSAAENAAIFKLAKANYDAVDSIYIAPDGGNGCYVWLGGTDSAREGVWRWSDGSQISNYSNWGSGNGVSEPDNYNNIQDHLAMGLDGWPQPSQSIGTAGEWNDISGTNGLWSIIEWDGLIGTAKADRIAGSALAEYFFGGVGNDTLTGLAGNDRIEGGDGADNLDGGLGADTIFGGTGADRVVGGHGTDQITGGVGFDVFVFDDGHTGKGLARDIIRDFQIGTDDLNLRNIDANLAMSGDQNFRFSGTTATAHSIWYIKNTNGLLIRGDFNGDRIYDFEIQLNNASSLSTGDLVL